jgi:hypothetical protein
VARAAFFRTEGGSCAPGSWGLRLWNGRGEQMVSVFFPNPHFDDEWKRLREPRWEKTALWEDLRARYATVDMGGPETAPHTPQRSSRHGEAAALLDLPPPTGR